MAASVPKRAKLLLILRLKPANCDDIHKIVKMRWELIRAQCDRQLIPASCQSNEYFEGRLGGLSFKVAISFLPRRHAATPSWWVSS